MSRNDTLAGGGIVNAAFEAEHFGPAHVSVRVRSRTSSFPSLGTSI
jgi:hypothetical protein